ncbi:16S rRNA (cytosine(967)-C(5))-methyltransferase RsmB [Paenibacillus sp. LHD-117]|uniref:16S rRNA (cytosine(967)-C(5))-methyltransferase RsmB n=1 Tax=Paenibacillus sp. LHD-117 TaxID=3071412 RepID=UPI0027E20AFF|nr:16S rRNA (cytosine(967)-C(5))-methyltransferase RsmB [Paenibacillus sp. LHD-117]MDQ6420829.1 16S rRNA (cytosine(967)-C(5))-methyltransferase RsmB [Paenibacillus sp. LHD-117]
MSGGQGTKDSGQRGGGSSSGGRRAKGAAVNGAKQQRAKGNAGHAGASSSRRAATPREIALDILTKVAGSGAYSNLQLNRALQDEGLSRPDAALATELVYGTIGRQATLDHWLDKFVAKGVKKLQPWVHQLLRLSAYQLLYLDRIPAHAAVNEAVVIAKRRGHAGISGMVNGVLRNVDRNRAELVPSAIQLADPIATIALRHSYPEWLVRRWADTYGAEQAEAICEAGNRSPHASIRANTLQGNRDELLAQLRAEGLQAEPSELAPAGIVVASGGNLADMDGFRTGRWSLQDESSMLVAEVLAPKAGMKVLDCCAAPGGKSAHMAELMEGKGKVWANDLHAHKRELIVQQTERLKLRNVEAVTGDAAALSERFAPVSMDAVLLDAPCSGFGVIRRKPEIKWTKTEGDIAEIGAVQRKLLDAVCGLVKPGGTLVYSTCTIEPEENERQIAAFLQAHPEFELDADWPDAVTKPLEQAGLIGLGFDGQLQLLPQHFGSDGFYIARMIRRPQEVVEQTL